MGAEWSSADARWTVEVERGDTGETVQLTCGFLFTCTGYYRYDEGYTPELDGVERFGGEIVHPQFWPEDIDYAGKRVVVIGSGATAVTLIPALARRAAHVTMLQRSPSYIISLPAVDPIAGAARARPADAARVSDRALEERAAHARDLQLQPPPARGDAAADPQAARAPAPARLRRRHALQPALRAVGPAHVHRARRRPLRRDQRRPRVGRHRSHRDAHRDRARARVRRRARGRPDRHRHRARDGAVRRHPPRRRRAARSTLGAALVYRGMQISGVPNMAFAFGYTNQSWTLGADLTCEQVCKLLEHMDRRGYTVCTPRNRDPAVTGRAVRRPHLGLRAAGRSTSSPSRGRRTPGGGSRTTRATAGRCGARRSRIPRSSSPGPSRRRPT